MNENVVDKDDNSPPFDIAKFRNMRSIRKKINALLDDEKPALILSSRGGTMGTLATTNGASFATDAKPALPELEMGNEHFNRLIRLLQANKEVELEAEVRTRFNDKDTMQYNVVQNFREQIKN